MRYKLVVLLVTALLLWASSFTGSAQQNMCFVPAWSVVNANGGMNAFACDTLAEWIAGYYAANPPAETATTESDPTVDDFNVEERREGSQLVISRADGATPTVEIDGSKWGPFDYTFRIAGRGSVGYALSVSADSVLTVKWDSRTHTARKGGANNNQVKITFRIDYKKKKKKQWWK